jgi:hypothetical protein
VSLNAEEKHAIESFAGSPQSPLYSALDKFCAHKKQEMEANSADAMRSVPRQYEVAADYAAKADAYRNLLNDLERFVDEV